MKSESKAYEQRMGTLNAIVHILKQGLLQKQGVKGRARNMNLIIIVIMALLVMAIFIALTG